ncbi:MAG: VWA domain-containing protein [Acidobacteria bacterium]|nr:VWA domain-containing protein [Acidobacteriota bacterium]
MRITRRSFAAASLGAPLAAQQKLPEETPEDLVKFVTYSRQVIAPTTVTDKEGGYVPNLQPHEFRLFDNGKPQKVTIENAARPLSLVVCVQANNTVESVLPNIKKIGLLLEGTVLGDNGQAAILAFDHRVRVMQDFTHDGDLLTKALNKINAGSTTSAMVDAVSEAARMLRRRDRSHKKVILLISETRDKGSQGKTRQALLDLQFGDVVVYSLNINRLVTSLMTRQPAPRPPSLPPGARHMPAGAPQTPESMAAYTGHYSGNYVPVLVEILRQAKALFVDNHVEAFTKHTGGTERSFLTFKDLERVVQDIGQEMQNQYLISYSPSTKDDGGYHEIVLQVTRPELRVRTRPGYWMAAIPEHMR